MNLQSILFMIKTGIDIAKATGKVDPKIMGYIETADNAITAALEAVEKSKTGVDPSQLKPIEPVT